jgi:hypothetical protein
MYNIIWRWIGRRVMVRIVEAAHTCGVIDDEALRLLVDASNYYEKKVDYVIYFMCARDVSSSVSTNKSVQAK